MKLTEQWYQNELKRWRTGEWCTLCEAPQWLMPDGEHWCASIPTLQNHRYHQNEEIFKLRSALKQIQHYLAILKTDKDLSHKFSAFNLAEETIRITLNGHTTSD